MESYNALNDTFMTQNKRLLQTILKDKIGFKGFIMSDWYAINSDNCTHFSNGCDMNQPGFLANFLENQTQHQVIGIIYKNGLILIALLKTELMMLLLELLLQCIDLIKFQIL